MRFWRFWRRKKENRNYKKCYVCGREFPIEDLHHIVLFFSTKVELYVCDECINIPPSRWSKCRRKE